MTLDTHEEKCQTETVKETLKSLSEPQQYIIDIKSLNIYTSSLKMHFSDISDSEKKMKEELMNVNAAYQQFSKIAL